MNTPKTVASSYHLNFLMESHFPFIWVIEFSVTSPCLGKSKVFLITITWQT